MNANQGMLRRRQFRLLVRRKTSIANYRARMEDAVLQDQAFDELLHFLGQRVIARPHVRELRLTAVVDRGMTGQQRIFSRIPLVGSIGVPTPAAEIVHAAAISRAQYLAVLAEVG